MAPSSEKNLSRKDSSKKRAVKVSPEKVEKKPAKKPIQQLSDPVSSNMS